MEDANVSESFDHQSSSPDHALLLRSRVVLPVSRTAIEDGAVLVSGNRIIAVDCWKNLSATHSAEIIDLGDSILMPGLVNAHCHLDYTDMAGLLPPQKLFTDWITLMLATKAEWTYTEFAESWLHGAQMLLRTGTTTVADFEAVPELIPDVWSSTPLRVLSFMELTGVKSRRSPRDILNEAVTLIAHQHDEHSQGGLAPHAPYSTVPELIRLTAGEVQKRNWPISIHVSESAQEFEMFTRAQGGMFEWLRRNERDMSDCGHGSPVQHLERNGALSEKLLAVHVNYLAPGDAGLLARRDVSVVHCPRRHFYFQHAAFPFAELTAANVNICIGTDSLATVFKTRKEVVELNMFDEMRAFAGTHPGTPAEAILQMATVNGARALGRAGEIGEISPGALADLAVIPFAGDATGVYPAVLQHRGEVTASMIDGEWAFLPNQSATP
jgi:cytosine/adenosine deaminase-related metal-dependent hydrolase